MAEGELCVENLRRYLAGEPLPNRVGRKRGYSAVAKKRIVLLGAGSAVFTKGLVADLILAPQQGPWELALVDIDPSALEAAEQLARRMVEMRGADVSIEAATDRRDVLAGADVVIATIGVGGRRGWEQDVFIPRKYGIFQPVGDSMLPGGISRAMRMIPALVDVAEDVKRLAPQTRFVNYSNPMTANCMAIIQATGVPVMGLCHGAFRVEHELADLIGAPHSEVSSIAVGLNHLTFFYDFRWKGQDAWPLVRERLARERDLPFDPESFGKTFPRRMTTRTNPFSWSLFEQYGAYPSANDRHVTEFFPERFPHGQYYGRTLGVDAFSFEHIIAWGDERYAAMRAQALGEQPLDTGVFERAVGEHEQLLEILDAIERDTRRIFFVNLPNHGAAPNLPYDAVLEMPAVATAGGLRPMQYPDFPAPLAAVITRKLASIQLTVEAALTGSRALFVEALLADGAVTDPDVARRMGEELLEAHRPYLPQFFQ